MKNEESKPKTVVNSRGYIEDELIEDVKNTEGFQRAVDLHEDGKLEKVFVSFKEKQEQKEHIVINSDGITRETIPNVSEVRQKVDSEMKKKDKETDMYGYSYQE